MSSRIAAAAAAAVLIASTVSAQAATVEVTIRKLVFSPVAIAVRPGDTVVWINQDPFAHTATVKGGWDVAIPPKASGRFTLKTAGTFDYFCRFHPNMKGRISVSP